MVDRARSDDGGPATDVIGGAPVRRRTDDLAGIYIHVPFCARQCPYCDFAVDVRRTIPHREYADAIVAEFDRRKARLDRRRVQTVYFGGGTPSLWRPDQLARVLAHLFEHLGERPVEVCMEANPVDITRENLRAWTDAGVGRLSIGCQSFQPRVLDILNRNHTREQALEAVELAIEYGPPAVSLDLIFGNPEQTMAEWQADLDVVEGLGGLAHLSAYNLTIEPGTAFQRRVQKGRLDLPDDDQCFEMLDYLVARCEAMGLERYEVSNFARPGHRSQHNTLYWVGAEYLGLGVGAHSLHIDENEGVIRRSNPRRTATYLEVPGEPAEVERLSPLEHLTERLFLGIRTRAGLDYSQARAQFQGAVDAERLDKAEVLLEEMLEQGFLEWDAGTYRPTHRGLNVADALAERFFAAFDAASR